MSPQEQSQFQILRALERDPRLTQRQLAQVLGVSNGKLHYLMVALVQKGLIKLEHFKNNAGKLGKIAYLLTPEGVRLRMAQTDGYLARKQVEFDALQAEIATLKIQSDSEIALPQTPAMVENSQMSFGGESR
jgi:EPS-associated MarR family transcriptional regulator